MKTLLLFFALCLSASAGTLHVVNASDAWAQLTVSYSTPEAPGFEQAPYYSIQLWVRPQSDRDISINWGWVNTGVQLGHFDGGFVGEGNSPFFTYGTDMRGKSGTLMIFGPDGGGGVVEQHYIYESDTLSSPEVGLKFEASEMLLGFLVAVNFGIPLWFFGMSKRMFAERGD